MFCNVFLFCLFSRGFSRIATCQFFAFEMTTDYFGVILVFCFVFWCFVFVVFFDFRHFFAKFCEILNSQSIPYTVSFVRKVHNFEFISTFAQIYVHHLHLKLVRSICKITKNENFLVQHNICTFHSSPRSTQGWTHTFSNLKIILSI